MDFLEWAIESVGTNCADPYRLVLDLGRGDRGIPLLCCPRHLRCAISPDLREFTGTDDRPPWRRSIPKHVPETLADSAAISLDHGRLPCSHYYLPPSCRKLASSFPG
jgi:hypothetical protein